MLSWKQKLAAVTASSWFLLAAPAFAREVRYVGAEQTVYVNPGEPTQVLFPGKVVGGFKSKNSPVALERDGNFLVVFAQPDLTEEGAAILVILEDKRSFAVRITPASDDHVRDEVAKIIDGFKSKKAVAHDRLP